MLGAIVYLVAPISIAFIAYALYRRVQFWRVGASYDELGSHGDRIREFLRAGAFGFGGHGKFHPRRERYASVMHFAIFWGFRNPFRRDYCSRDRVQFRGIPWHNLPDSPFQTANKLYLGCVRRCACRHRDREWAYWRRYVVKPQRLNSFADDSLILAYLLLLLLTGFALEGLRIGATELNPDSTLYAPSHRAVVANRMALCHAVPCRRHDSRSDDDRSPSVVVDTCRNLRRRSSVRCHQFQQTLPHHRIDCEHLPEAGHVRAARSNRWETSNRSRRSEHPT